MRLAIAAYLLVMAFTIRVDALVLATNFAFDRVPTCKGIVPHPLDLIFVPSYWGIWTEHDVLDLCAQQFLS